MMPEPAREGSNSSKDNPYTKYADAGRYARSTMVPKLEVYKKDKSGSSSSNTEQNQRNDDKKSGESSSQKK